MGISAVDIKINMMIPGLKKFALLCQPMTFKYFCAHFYNFYETFPYIA